MKKTNVLVTGSHRSGTTWLAKVLSSSPLVHYIPEPFNLSFKHPGSPFQHWFQYVPVDSEEINYENYINKFLRFTLYGALEDVKKIRSKSLLKSYLQDHYEKISKPVNLMKDPIAIMSAEWLYHKFDMKVIVVIRHPAAFASSIKVKNWNFHFGALLRQEDLIEKYFINFKHEIELNTTTSPDLINQAILLWKLIYYRIDKYRKIHKDWLFVKHEDLSLNPTDEIRKIAELIDIPFDRNISKSITETTSGNKNDNSIVESIRDSINRNSSENVFSWKERLTQEEIAMVKEKTKDIWRLYYNENDW